MTPLPKTFTLARIVLGAIMLVFGLNGFFVFLRPPVMEYRGTAFIQVLIATKYMLPLWKGTEVITGALLLANRYVALAVVLLAPVVVNIFFFHLFLDQRNLPVGITVLILLVLVGISQEKKYRPLFQPN